MKSKLITLALCAAAMILSQAAVGAVAQDAQAPAPASSAAGHGDTALADRPASIDEDRPLPQPHYSAAMKNTAGSGTVVVMVQVDAEGKIQSVHVMMSSGARQLDDEAIRTAKSWSYKPAIKNGVATGGYVQVPITFNK
ncbi:energy transducer TonB [Dyella japonica]|uniref:energy transducer TonB n=1 Tax=Dyella japonica TaxID=231455 RepID=UPI0002F8F869|nr:energy transducer TonB [Dyella japonica]